MMPTTKVKVLSANLRIVVTAANIARVNLNMQLRNDFAKNVDFFFWYQNAKQLVTKNVQSKLKL